MSARSPAGLVFVGDRCCDHSPSSGYDQVCSIFPDAGWLSGRALEAGRTEWLRRPAGGGASPRLFHVFYGDCSGSAVPAILRSRFGEATIVLSVHQPVARMLADGAAKAALAHADSILTVSERQARELAAHDLEIPVRALPHGVWTRAFRPARPLAGERREVLLVGNHLRDWPSTIGIVELLAGAGVRCRVVGRNAPAQLLAGHGSVTISPPLSERELAAAYDRAVALLMPVLDATASNALLEAMSAGCPVVSSASPSLVDEYLGDRVDCFGHGDHEQAVAHLLRYAGDPQRRAARSRALIRRSRRFDWSNLAERYARALAGEPAQAVRGRCGGEIGGRLAAYSPPGWRTA